MGGAGALVLNPEDVPYFMDGPGGLWGHIVNENIRLGGGGLDMHAKFIWKAMMVPAGVLPVRAVGP